MTSGDAIYIGLMSGTSLDSVDAVAVTFTPDFQLLASHTEEIPVELKAKIRQLMQPGDNEIDLLGSVDLELGHLFAKATENLITQNKIERKHIRAIGSHGQTIRHRPELGFTLQIGDANTIAEQTNITTVSDFRRRDMAAGGQGAPLVPAFHEAMFRTSETDRILLNIGGMANISFLAKQPDTPVSGFDTGPGNILLNSWIEKHKNQSFDRDGKWASQGTANKDLLNTMLDLEYFRTPPPKSTGRELFNLNWLETVLDDFTDVSAVDVQATLTQLTASTIANSIRAYIPSKHYDLFVCGGGCHNDHLMQLLRQELPEIKVEPSGNAGLEADWMEACAFAWLAKQCIDGQTGNSPDATGATGNRILGAVYQA